MIFIYTKRKALDVWMGVLTIPKQLQKKLEATEIWFLWRMLQILWTAKKSNETELQEADATRSLIKRIHVSKHQASFCGHVMGKEKWKYYMTTGRI